VALLETIYYWIKDVIDTLLEGKKATVNFIKEFPETMKQFFSDLLEKSLVRTS
jgi:hypothetical protein